MNIKGTTVSIKLWMSEVELKATGLIYSTEISVHPNQIERQFRSV